MRLQTVLKKPDTNSVQAVAEYKTRDLYLSVVLKQLNINLIRVERNGGRGIFVFEACPEIEKIISQYFNDRIETNPRQLFECWKSLKSMAFASIGDVR